jgi:hypothetical protein
MFQYIIKQYQTSLKQAIRKVTTIITTSYKENHGLNKNWLSISKVQSYKSFKPKARSQRPNPDNNDDIKYKQQ